MCRRESSVKLWISYDMLTNHRPKVWTLADRVKSLELTIIIFIVIFAKRHLGSFHFLLFFDESFDDVSVLSRCHGYIEEIDVIVVQDLDAVFEVPRFWCVCCKLKIRVRPPF